MKLTESIAIKLLSMIEDGKPVASSSIQSAVVAKMVDDGVLQKVQSGRTKAMLFVRDEVALNNYLLNQFGIADLRDYVEKVTSEELTRSEAVAVSGNSKLKNVRTFKGFLVNCYEPVAACLQGKPFVLNPTEGTFTFIYDFETFIPDPSVTVVGIENAENFRYAEQQRYLFKDFKPLFVTRYPHCRFRIILTPSFR